jgi:nucleoside phosphorylase
MLCEDGKMKKDVFVYHLDNELQKLFSLNRYDYTNLYDTLNIATRIAYLVCNQKILLPASNYFESDMSFQILNELGELNQIGAIELVSSSHNINELLSKKAGQHGNNLVQPNYHYGDFLNEQSSIVLPATLRKRERSASLDIKNGWYTSLGNPNFKSNLFNYSKDSVSASKFEDFLYEVPIKLNNKAFISDYVLPFLPIKNENINNANNLINSLVTREYINSFLMEFDAICLKDIPILDANSILPLLNDDSRFISYVEVANHLMVIKYKEKCAFDYIKNCSAYELIEFKNSPEWGSILFKLENRHHTLEKEMDGEKMNDYKNIKIGIITALPKELAAMKAMLRNVKECFFDDKGAGHRYFIGEIDSANNKTHLIALALCGMGNNIAAIRATNMLSHFKYIESIIMTGIAGGIPSYTDDDKQIRLGDIVVSNGVYQYDFVKEELDKVENRSNTTKPSASLLESANIMKSFEFENDFPWQKYIDEFSNKLNFLKPDPKTDILFDLNGKMCNHPYDPTRNNYPKVFIGKIASANTLLKNPQKRQKLKDDFGVIAIEMEASGISDASWNNEVGYLVVRGICDYCDDHKNDLWQNYAALVAAAYTRALIESLPSF